MELPDDLVMASALARDPRRLDEVLGAFHTL
jgi:hypothetical protein